MNTFNYGAIHTVQGYQAVKNLGEEVKRLHMTKALIVTDEGIKNAGQLAKAEAALQQSGIEYVVYDKIKTDPLDTMVCEALEIIKEEKCDIVIGFGGGSSMDVAKSSSLMMTNEGHIMEYTRINPNRRSFKNRRIPLILVPTTSGTGSEFSPFAVITNTKINRKSNVTSEYFYADTVILDPDLATTLSKQMTVSSGFDALAHAMDGITVKENLLNPNIYVEMLGLKSMELVFGKLRTAVAFPESIEARWQVMIGANMAGAILSSGTGATHGLANMLSKYYHVPHGESVGMLLPYVMEYNLPACPEVFAKMAEAIGVKKQGMSDMEAGKAVIEAVKELAEDVKLPGVADYIKDEKEIYDFLEESIDNSCNYANAREIDLKAAEQIFISAYRKK